MPKHIKYPKYVISKSDKGKVKRNVSKLRHYYSNINVTHQIRNWNQIDSILVQTKPQIRHNLLMALKKETTV